MAVFLLSAYFQSVPRGLEDVARLEGVGPLRFTFSILLPVARPIVGTIVISCLNTWNEFLMAMLFVIDRAMRTLPAGVMAFEQAHSTEYPALLAELSRISVPTLLVNALFHKHVIRGVLAGAVK